MEDIYSMDFWQEERSDTSFAWETLAISNLQVKVKYWTFQFYAILLLSMFFIALHWQRHLPK